MIEPIIGVILAYLRLLMIWVSETSALHKVHKLIVVILHTVVSRLIRLIVSSLITTEG